MLSIARLVEEVRMVSPDRDGPFHVDWLPDGRTSLVIRVEREGRGDATVLGPRTRAKFKRATGFERATAIQFKPGWSASLFGVPANALTDRLIPLAELWGASELTAQLIAARTVPAILAHLSSAVATRAAFESASAHLARRALRRFEAAETRVEVVAAQLGVTARHLRRAFVEHVGVAPKEFARGIRLRRAIEASARSHDWSVIAQDAGYYDQSHLIGDFRELVGLTPAAYVARRA